MTGTEFKRRIVIGVGIYASEFMLMRAAVRRMRLVQVVLLVSIALYAAAGERLARTVTHDPANALFHALSLISISLVGATVVMRRTLVFPAEAVLKERPDDNVAVARWRAGYTLLYLLCEALGLFGFVLRVLGFTLANVWGFYLGGFLLLLLYSPRTPRAEVK
jgi:hypothetical protein